MLFKPFEFDILSCEFIEMSCDVAEVWNELAIVANKFPKSSELPVTFLKGIFQSVTAFILSGSIAICPLEHDMSKIFDGGGRRIRIFSSCNTTCKLSVVP